MIINRSRCFSVVLEAVADFQITHSNDTGNRTKRGLPRLVFKRNMTKVWVGGSTEPPRDRPICGFDNELCPPPTEDPQGWTTLDW